MVMEATLQSMVGNVFYVLFHLIMHAPLVNTFRHVEYETTSALVYSILIVVVGLLLDLLEYLDTPLSNIG